MPKLLHELLLPHVAARPEGIAISWKDEKIPFGELDRLTNQLARALRRHDCRSGDHVAVLMPNSANSVLAVLGILKAGCVAVPINIATPAQQVAEILGDCRPAMILAGRSAQTLLDQVLCNDLTPYRVGTLEALPIEGEYYSTEFNGMSVLRESSAALACGATRHAPAFSFSGSSDLACDVNDPASQPVFGALDSTSHAPTVVTHAEVLAFLSARQRLPLTEFDRVAGLPLHMPLAVAEVFASLMAGAELHVVPQELAGKPESLTAFVRTHEITEWLTSHESLSDAIHNDQIGYGDLPTLKHLLWTGDALCSDVLHELTQRLPLTQLHRTVIDSEAKIGELVPVVASFPENELVPLAKPQPVLSPA